MEQQQTKTFEVARKELVDLYARSKMPWATYQARLDALRKQYCICPKCGTNCGYWNLPLGCGR